MNKFLSLILLLPLFGCGFVERHPTQAKIYALVGGASIGAVVGLKTKVQFCHYMYEGQPYYGSSCPAPKRSLK